MHLQTQSANSLAKMTMKKSLLIVFLAAVLLASSYVNAEEETKEEPKEETKEEPKEETKEEEVDLKQFPPGFLFGASTSSYQIEGAWNVSDKGINAWDHYTHTYPERMHGRSNGDVACDSYNNYAEDAQAVKDIGLNYYRFSISWARILPEGYSNVISKDGIAYYHKVLDELEKRNVTPLVTLYHWDHPQMFQDMGGWTNELMVEWYTDYARVVFKEFGHRVKQWITINEPNAVCIYAYVYGSTPPGLKLGSHAAYVCNQNVLKGHANVYRVYKKEFDTKNEGKMGITLELRNYFPRTENDTEAAEIGFQYQFGVYAHPIYSKTGDWPDLLKKRIAEHSEEEKLPRSRLPEFSPYWKKRIQGSADFLGLNHYSSLLVELAPKRQVGTDDGLVASFDPSWPASTYGWLKIVPHGFLNALRRIKSEYDNPEVWVTENGIPDHGVLADNERLDYLHGYIKNMLIAINKYKCNVKRYTVWSLLDNFEWYKGYERKFGLYQIDFNSPNKTRTPKNSVRWLREVIKAKRLLPETNYILPVPQQISLPCVEDTPGCSEFTDHLAPQYVDIWYRD